MSLYPKQCHDCGLALRATSSGRVCPECGVLYPSRDREMRELSERQAVARRARDARAAVRPRPVAAPYVDVPLFGVGPA